VGSAGTLLLLLGLVLIFVLAKKYVIHAIYGLPYA
jgi:hypothetical protein